MLTLGTEWGSAHRHPFLDIRCVGAVMRGDIDQAISLFTAKERRAVATFVGGARTDTIEERCALERQAYPFLRQFGKRLGVPVIFLDSRWGNGRHAAGRSIHGGSAGPASVTDASWAITASTVPCECTQDISYCVHECSGIAFMGLLGSKYGARSVNVVTNAPTSSK